MKKSNTFKKICCTLLAAISAGSVFSAAGCKPIVFKDLEIPEGGYDGSAVKIMFYHTMGQDLSAQLDKAIVEFNKLYPNITVEWKQVGGYDDVRDKIKKELIVGGQPNIAYCYPDHVASYNVAGGVQSLDDLIASTIVEERADGTTETLGLTAEQIADFIPGYYNEGKAFGDLNGDGVDEMYTLPFSKSTEVLFYNKSFFDEMQRLYANEFVVDAADNFVLDENGQKIASIGYQNENYNLFVPTTWDEMETMCARLKVLDKDCIPLGYDSESNWFINMCMQYGSPYTSVSGDEQFLFNNQTNWEFVARFREWYQKGYVTTQEIFGSYTSGLFNNIPTEKNPTRSYMGIGSTAGAAKQRPAKGTNGYPFETGIASIPQVNPEKPQVISQGPSVCIFKKDNPQEVIASWLLVKYLTTDVVFQGDFSMVSGYMPVIQSVGDDPFYKNQFLKKADGYDYVTALSVKVALEQADAYYVSPAFRGSSVARDQVGLLLRNAFTKEPSLTGDAAMEYIKRLFKDAVDECKYQA